MCLKNDVFPQLYCFSVEHPCTFLHEFKRPYAKVRVFFFVVLLVDAVWWGRRVVSGNMVSEKQLFCFCRLCVCVSKEIIKFNVEVMSALKQYFVMSSVPLFYHSSIPLSTYVTLRNLANCIMLPTHWQIVPYPGTFVQNIQSWDKWIFMSTRCTFSVQGNTMCVATSAY
jgi:hypothetical protein